VKGSRSRFRIRYYDVFSRVYDRFVAAHSSDPEGRLREEMAERAALRAGNRALDLAAGVPVGSRPPERLWQPSFPFFLGCGGVQ